MLPYRTGGDLAPGKYGDWATESLLEVALRAGSRKFDLVASLYGGGRVIGHLGSVISVGGTSDIGARNIQVAHEVLARNDITIIHEDVGGIYGRKIQMDVETNDILVRKIVPAEETQMRTKKIQEFKGRRIKVLIVDDSATVRHLLRRAIEMSDDMEVVGEAENPYEARELILETDPDVLCLDIIMPRLDGHSFLKKLMQYKPIPTIVVSTIAKRGSEMRQKVMQAGAVGVIDKEELEIYKGLDVVRKVLLPELRRAAESIVKPIKST
jgi:chemotaxis receptor (MCP) glutamine deamidase CheD/CheY-like chemotaxis protein